ncbi:hypothetical protein Rmf_51660 [Roseomonas fluvialis]|uniref:Uncharacterized protein n=1 Tax=Roseomonas fluvialis TaxID=1750527 RepID=A0ABN6PBD1_9PROT|nr:hypothetical protein Rmf_51660 [Roseomonas fluvialis]
MQRAIWAGSAGSGWATAGPASSARAATKSPAERFIRKALPARSPGASMRGKRNRGMASARPATAPAKPGGRKGRAAGP